MGTLEMRALLFPVLLLVSTIARGSFIRFLVQERQSPRISHFCQLQEKCYVLFLFSSFPSATTRKQKTKTSQRKKQCYYHSDTILDSFLSQQIGTLMDWLHFVSSCSGLCFSFGEAGSRPQHLLHGRQGFHFTNEWQKQSQYFSFSVLWDRISV